MMDKLRELANSADELYILSRGFPVKVGPEEWLEWHLNGHGRLVMATPVGDGTKVVTIFWGLIKDGTWLLFETAVLQAGNISVMGRTSTLDSALSIHNKEVSRLGGVGGVIAAQPAMVVDMAWVGRVVSPGD